MLLLKRFKGQEHLLEIDDQLAKKLLDKDPRYSIPAKKDDLLDFDTVKRRGRRNGKQDT
jgi:hypothetical protein